LTLKGKQYIVPVVLDSSNQIDNFDFRNLPNISDEDCGIAMEIIETQIDQMPPLADCQHVKDDPKTRRRIFTVARHDWQP
jgi:hypothetical protein